MGFRGGRKGKGDSDEGGQKVHTCSYKTGTSWGCNVRHADGGQHCCVEHLKVANRP